MGEDYFPSKEAKERGYKLLFLEYRQQFIEKYKRSPTEDEEVLIIENITENDVINFLIKKVVKEFVDEKEC